MTTGVIALAVPLSTSFAGEFLILAGVFQQGWVWAVIGATGIVLAAMYMLRAISGILHQEPGPAVSDAALDLRLGELAVVVPLVVCLLGLSAWPNLISGHASARQPGEHDDRGGARQVIVKPHVDWFAISPSLSLLAAAALLLMVAVFVPVGPRGAPSPRSSVSQGSRPHSSSQCSSTCGARWRRRSSATRSIATAGRRSRRCLIAGAGGDCGADRLSGTHARRAHRRVLRAAHRRRRRDGVLRPGGEPDDALPRPRVVLDRALRADGDRHRPDRIARGRPQVPDRRRGRLGDAALRLGARLRRRPASCRSTRSGRTGTAATRCSSSASR